MLKILTNNRLFFIFFLVWVLFGAILQLISSPTDLMFLINQHHSLELDAFFRFVTTLGEDTIWLILLLALLYRHFVKKVKQTAIVKFLLISWILKVLVSLILKNIFNHPRPIEVYQNSGRAINLVEGVTMHHWQSFPSGHTTTAFAFACFCAIVFRKTSLSIILLVMAMLVGFSRMYLFQHFPRDVFAGSILGVAVVVVMAKFFYKKEEISA